MMQDERRNERLISVVGVGTASGRPDTAVVELGVSTMRPSVADATNAGEQAASAVRHAILQEGIEVDDLATSRFSLHPEHDHRGSQPVVTGYRITTMLEVTVRTLKAVPDVISGAVHAGGDAVVVHRVDFHHSRPTELLADARADAWRDALARAGQLADLAGVQLGLVRSVVERTGGSPTPHAMMARGMELAASPPIEPGSRSVQVELDVTYEIASDW